MARPREFDPKAALQIAIQVFWEQGYNNTSVDEIVQRSGVAKYGIYGTFGPKRELFKKALAQYAADRHRDMQRPIRQADASLPEIRNFFENGPRLIVQQYNQRGCLMCNTGMELGLRDPEINTFVKEFFADTAKVLKDCLMRAVEKGELEAPEDIEALAKYLATEFQTVLMLARSGYNFQDIQQHVNFALRVLQ